MINIKQLLQLIVEKPNKSTCDLRFLSHIWEAFLRYCAEQFEAKVGVRVLGMGEFCYRKDSIGGMEFLNPMFMLSEGFANTFGLHDRRPKTQVHHGDVVDLDVSAIAGKTSDMLGEVVGREVVEHALHDLVERIGEVCSDPDNYGIVTLDFGFAKLFCENKSLEFSFGGGGAPGTALSSKSLGGGGGSRNNLLPPIGEPPATASSAKSGASRASRQADAPLQRPHRPHRVPVQFCTRLTKQDLIRSHAKQLTEKELVVSTMREEETAQHLETLQRLRSEMVLDYSQREQRRTLTKQLAIAQKQQQEDKRTRERHEKRAYAMDHWPFRTEEQVEEAAAATNAAQKAYLDRQLAEKREKLQYLKAEAAKRQAAEQAQALAELKALDTEKRGGRGAPAAKGAPPVHSVEKTMEDAFSRYEEYLHTRKEGIEVSASFQREQRYLSEQAELLKAEEQRRRMAEMRSYLERQIQDKQAERAVLKAESKENAYTSKDGKVSGLPGGSEIDAEEEAYVKMALKNTLDQQVARKERAKVSEKALDLAAEQQALQHVASEMQEARFRTWKERKSQEENLRATWQKQQQLKLMEATLEKAEGS